MESENKEVILPNSVQEDEPELDLSELFYRILDKKWNVLACAFIMAVLFAIYNFFLSVPIYEATSKVYVVSANDSIINMADLQLGNTLAADYIEIFDTWEVNQMVVDNLGLPYTWEEAHSMVKVTRPQDTRILCISVRSKNAEESALMANEYATVFREYVAQAMLSEMPEIMSEALVPRESVNINGFVGTILGGFIGFFIGIAIVVVQFLVDDKLKTAEAIQKTTGLITLAMIPVEKNDENAGTRKNKGNRGALR